MNELEQALIGDSYAAPPSHMVEALDPELANRVVPGAPRSIYAELWHIAFWQQVTLDWLAGVETPFPATPAEAFPTDAEIDRESWADLCKRFRQGNVKAAEAARLTADLDRIVRCPSRPGQAARLMSVRDQLISLAAHNAYHFGRVVLLRQLLAAWPPPSGGFTW